MSENEQRGRNKVMVLRTNQFLIHHTQLHISSRACGRYLTKKNSAEFQLSEMWSQDPSADETNGWNGFKMFRFLVASKAFFWGDSSYENFDDSFDTVKTKDTLNKFNFFCPSQWQRKILLRCQLRLLSFWCSTTWTPPETHRNLSATDLLLVDGRPSCRLCSRQVRAATHRPLVFFRWEVEWTGWMKCIHSLKFNIAP